MLIVQVPLDKFKQKKDKANPNNRQGDLQDLLTIVLKSLPLAGLFIFFEAGFWRNSKKQDFRLETSSTKDN
jgi:hypothetical protein